ncbi:MAG: ROK family protein, partial [Pirellulales bacterium]
MYLGIEIGGTKLQLGVGAGDGSPLVQLLRFDVDPSQGAAGILRRIEKGAQELLQRHPIAAIGCGFGGPVDVAEGRVVKSHHVAGWNGLELADWLQRLFGVPAAIANDADTAGLAEARFGAGFGASPVLYVTVGTGIGAGLIVDGQIYAGCGRGAAELGHLRPGLHADRPDENLESLAAGWGIAAAAQSRLSGGAVSHRFSSLAPGLDRKVPDAVRQRLIEAEAAAEEFAADLLTRCDGIV